MKSVTCQDTKQSTTCFRKLSFATYDVILNRCSFAIFLLVLTLNTLNASVQAFVPTSTTPQRQFGASVMTMSKNSNPLQWKERRRRRRNYRQPMLFSSTSNEEVHGDSHNNNKNETPSSLNEHSVVQSMSQQVWRWTHEWKSKLPPAPEAEFILIGDLVVLCLYAMTSHSLNNWIVSSVLESATNVQEAVQTLDPTGDVVSSLPTPVWLEPAGGGHYHSALLEGVWKVQAQDSLMDHYGPLFATTGTSWVALGTAWLASGWWLGAFLWKNSLDCDATRALLKTCQTWMGMLVLLGVGTLGINQVVAHFPLLQAHLGCPICVLDHKMFLWTKADTMFLIDSATVLFAWRYMVNSMMKQLF